ncbi:MAG TPA: ABC transporter permease, partial [Bacillota bacterium]|nr:ABC transporter permease [Bacillota bacterium]
MKAATRQIIFVICFIIAWQIIYSMKAFPEILFPSVTSIFEALKEGFVADDLMSMVLYSLSLILKGMLIGIVLAFIFSSLAVVNRVFYDIYNLIVSIMDLIPGVALLPLAILWFGIGEITIIFIMIHSIFWP